MADTKVTGLTANTTPALTDLLYLVDDPAGVPLGQKITVQNLRGGYVMEACHASFDPADLTTYFFGSKYATAPTTTVDRAVCIIPRTGTITAISYYMNTLGTLGTSVTTSLIFLLNSVSTTTITAALNNNAVNNFGVATVSIAVTAGEYFEIRWSTPTWATNPTTVTIHASVYVS